MPNILQRCMAEQHFVREGMTRTLLYAQVQAKSPGTTPSLRANDPNTVCLLTLFPPLSARLSHRIEYRSRQSHAEQRRRPNACWRAAQLQRCVAGCVNSPPSCLLLSLHPFRSPAVHHILQVSISGQALVFVVRTVRWSLMELAGLWTYAAFFCAQVLN